MKVHEDMEKSAIDVVTELLSRRLEVGGVSTSRPDFYFQCEPGHPTEYPGGFKVRVRTWRHWSSARVYFDADSRDLFGYSISRYAEPSTEREMSRDEALKAAEVVIDIPQDAELERFYHYEYMPQCKVARLQWRHVHMGLCVHGDFLYVVIHPETGRVIEYFRKWHEVRIR